MPRYSLKTLLIAVAVVAACLGAWSFLFRKVVHFRPPRPDDRVGQRELRRPPDSDEEVRNIAYAIGRFNHWTRLHVSLIAIQAGKQEVHSESNLRRNRWDQATFPSTFETMLVLRSRHTPQGPYTFVDHKGLLMSGVGGPELPLKIPASFTYSFSGTISSGRPYIVYVEGDTPITVNRAMTPAEFAKSHSGNYFVVTAELK